MFYTLGGQHYEKLLEDNPNLRKAVGGWALSIEASLEFKKTLKTESIHGLKQGEYGIYELPDCTSDMVDGEYLVQPTRIGKKVA